MPPKPKTFSRERLRLDADWRFYRGELPAFPYTIPVPQWRFKNIGKSKPSSEKPPSPKLQTQDWKTIKPWQDAFQKEPGYAWFRASLPDAPPSHRTLHFSSISDNATVFLNGKNLFYHEGWTDPFDVPLEKAWKEGNPNHLAVLVQNTYGIGFIGDANLEPAEVRPAFSGPAAASFEDRAWRKIHLPHDFVVEGSFQEKTNDPAHGYLPKGIGWYRKSLSIPLEDQGKSLWIDFDGVFHNCRVWLNGKPLGRHKSGYTSFRFDITKEANYGGENILAVRVDARGHEGWWYEGGGIYRHVWLNKADPLHLEPWGTFVVSKPQGPGAALALETTLVNQSGKPSAYKLISEIFDGLGKKILQLSTHGTISAGGKKSIRQNGKISRSQLWSLENPHLYQLRITVERTGKKIDQQEVKFGVRSIRFDKDKGFFLNGKSVKLKGTCNHQDHAGAGVALRDRLFTYRLEKLKEMGSNSYRCSHNPPAPELLDECDRLGILVIDENRRLGNSPEILSQVESMVRRDRNHPSIILWSICNEESKQGTPEGAQMARSMKKTILKWDKTRPVTAAMNGGWGKGLTGVIDVQGFNYNIIQYDPFRKKFPEMPTYGSETASTVSTRGVYETDRARGFVSAYDVNHTEWTHRAESAWRPIADRDYMAGTFVWTGFDYKGEPTPYGWPCVNSHFGILDVCGFPKNNFYYYQAWWSGKPVLHLFPHWNWPDKKGKQVDVWCHTNYDRILFELSSTVSSQSL